MIPSTIKKIARAVISALNYLHESNICHRDIKLTNVMVRKLESIKIIDFGFATSTDIVSKLFCGTPAYMSPELIKRQTYNGKKSDIWAFGVLFYKLITGRYPFGKEGDPDLKSNISNIVLDYKGVTKDFRTILELIFVYEHEGRPTAGRIEELLW